MDFSYLLLILTLNIYFEARGEPVEGMQAVADTVINRVNNKHYPNNVADVILQRRQFSWVNGKNISNIHDLIALQRVVLHSKRTAPKDIVAYRKAEQIALRALQGGYTPRYKATHFHSRKIPKPYWAKGYKSFRIGNHIFYRA